MALGATWWSGLGEASRWVDNFVGSLGTNSFVTHDGGFTRLSLKGSFTKFYQEQYTAGHALSGMQVVNPGWDSGFFSTEENITGEILYCDVVAAVDDPEEWALGAGAPYAAPQYRELNPVCRYRDLGPLVDPAGALFSYERAPFYRTPWYDQPDFTNQQANGFVVLWFPKKSGTWNLRHYAPWAWSGTPPEVIAACVMKSGLSSEYIDTLSFDNAHEAYDPSTGDQPWKSIGGGNEFNVYARRLTGQSVADFVFEVARHSRDFYYADEAGNFCCNSYTRPNNTTTFLNPSLGVLRVSWERSAKYITNKIACRWGHATRGWGRWDGRPGGTSHDYAAVFENNLDSYPGDKWLYEYDNTASQDAFGVRTLKGRDVEVNVHGIPRTAEVVSYPMILDNIIDTGAGPAHVVYWKDEDEAPRRFVTVVQDLRGSDYGLGDRVANVALTGDGDTIADTRCVVKSYNFDALTVESLLMEIP